MPIDPSTAFVSYSRVDAGFALKLGEDLKGGGANVWLDQLDIEPGERWARAVQGALNAASRVLVILSPASVNSTNVEDEVAFALEKRKKIIPVLYQDCEVPFQLLPFQYVDFRADYARGLGRLLKTLAAQSLASTSPPAAATVATAPALAVSPAPDSTRADEQVASAAEKQRFDEEERKRKAEEKALLEEQELQRIVAEQARLEEERKRKAAEERALLEEQERQRKAAEEKANIDEEEQQRVIAGELDAAWEAEKQRRQKELTKAIVAEWSAHGKVAEQQGESEVITNLKSALNAWLSRRPSGFESREAIRQQREKAAVQKAIETWRRTGG